MKTKNTGKQPTAPDTLAKEKLFNLTAPSKNHPHTEDKRAEARDVHTNHFTNRSPGNKA